MRMRLESKLALSFPFLGLSLLWAGLTPSSNILLNVSRQLLWCTWSWTTSTLWLPRWVYVMWWKRIVLMLLPFFFFPSLPLFPPPLPPPLLSFLLLPPFPLSPQFPQELVTYGGNGQVFSNWAQFWLTVHYLSVMEEDQTLVMYSGHPMGLFPSHPQAPRCVITNGMVHLDVCMFVCDRLYLSWLTVCLSACLSVCLSVCLLVCLSVLYICLDDVVLY